MENSMKPPTLPPAQISRASILVALLLLTALAAYVRFAGAGAPECKGDPKKLCVTLTPADGATVVGTVDVTAESKSNTPAVAVQFRVDGTALGSEDTSAPFTASWDSTRVANGSHTLTATARDSGGQTLVVQSNVTVNNPLPDTTPPSVQFTNPGEGSTVTGSANLDANASDNVAVAGVQFKVDGASVGSEDTSAPYSTSWDTTKAANGSHVLTAVARDAGGNTSTSQRSVKVSNPVTTPTATATPTGTPTPTPISGYSSAVLADSPVAYWRLGESSGTNAADASGAGRAGTYVGTPSFGLQGALSGDANTSVGLNGSSQYVEVPYSSALNPSQFTVEAWAYVTGGSGTYRAIVSNRDYSAGNTRGFILYAASDDTWRFWLGSGTDTWAQLFGPTLSLNTWTHLVGTFDGTTARMYVNGTLVGATAYSYAANAARPLRIAAGANERGSDYLFPGRVDEVAVYQSALSASRVQAHTTAGGSGSGTTPSPSDTTGPSIQLTSPAGGSTVSGTVNAAANASDNVGVAGVQFKIDGVDLGAEDTASPYTASWTSTAVANGAHTVSAVARDAAGNRTTAQVSVTVSNLAPAPTPGLRWQPPALTNPITLTIPTRGQESFSLAANQDYILKFQNGLRYGPLNFVGGRNLVLIGGEQIIDDTTSTDYGRRRLFEFRNQTGTIHIEGYYGHGPGLTEGINIWAPDAILQIQKTRIENVHRITPDANPQHPDIIQTWSGPRELRMWRFTGSTDYQGFWFSYAEGYAGAVWPGKIIMEDVNLHALPNPAWGGKGWNVDHMAFLNPATEFRLGNVWEETGWWNGTYHKGLKDSFGIRWSPTGGWTENNPLWSWREYWANGTAAGPEHVAEPYNASLSDAAPPEQGGWIVFTRPSTDNIWNADRTGPGKLFQGTPTGGDFVSASSVGANYR
jgi:hypothetical protein